MRVTSDVYRLDLPRPQIPPGDSKISTDDRLTEPLGIHVLDGEETVVFGTGYDHSGATLVSYLREFGGPDAIVVEHGDPDHYGALPALREAFPDATVGIPAPDADALSEVGVEPDVAFEDGDRHWGLRTILVPGHTPGNAAFLHEDTGSLFAGDTVVGSASVIAEAGDWSGPLAPPAEWLNADHEAAIGNLTLLDDDGFEAVLLMHGADVPEGGSAAVETLLRDLDLA